ncbi:LysR family transcriptional regulator [Salmonella enterica]|nr:LysR family transcriptional regulator [Salmonella enterica]EIR8814788.1 LysR family transcriptional regulator [Salmonella enterica]
MNIKQLHSFLILCDELHYGRAASRLFITQPSLSQQIKQLESSLKTILFKRKGRGIKLTKAGIILQRHANKIMLDLKNAENELLPYQNQQRDTISIGVSGSYLVLPAFRNFMAHHPEISLNVKEFSTEQTIKKLTDSAVDIGIVYRTALPAQLSSTMLFEDEIIAAIPLSHPLATRERLHLKDLNDQPIIVLNDSLLLRGIITTEFNNRKVVPNVICELDNHYSCLEYAEAQIGIAFITRSLTHLSTPKNVRLVSLGIPAFFIPVMLVHSNDLSLDNATICLLKQIKNFYTVDNKSAPEKSWPEQKIGV